MMQRIVSFWTNKKLKEAESRLVQLKVAVAEQEAAIAQLRNSERRIDSRECKKDG
jgi:hypothetical protein